VEKSNCAFITSYERDNESELDFAQNRYYNPKHGRFTSTDQPFADQFESNPQSWNLYLYVRNNPLNLVDPLGQSAGCPVFAECYTGEDGTTRYIDPASGEEIIYLGEADSGVKDERGSIVHEDGSRTMTNDQATQQQREARERFTWNNITAGIGHGIGKLFRGIGNLFRGKSPTPPPSGGVRRANPNDVRAQMPKAPESLQRVGRSINWGQGEQGALNRIQTLTRQEVINSGVTRAEAEAAREFYRGAAKADPLNKTAPVRAELMQKVVDFLSSP
jgi:RHS repeat-associated protein